MSTKVRLRLLMAGAAYFDTPTTSTPVRLKHSRRVEDFGCEYLYIGSEAKDTCAWPGTLHAVGRCCRTRNHTDVTIAIADMDAVTMA